MHPPEAHAPAPRSFREFLRAYAMIVLSILTALALEDAATAWSNREAAAASRARIDSEIVANTAELQKAIAANKATLKRTKAGIETLLGELKASATPDSAALDQILSKSVGMELPTWRRAAWDAAIADRSATFLAPADLRRFADLYATAEDIAAIERQSSLTSLFEAVADLQLGMMLGHPDLRQATLILLRFQSSATQVVLAQQQLLQVIRAAHGG